MKKLLLFVLGCGLALALPAQVLLEEPFTDAFSKNYEMWGASDFNRVEAFKGKLELEGSTGSEGFGIFFKQAFDLAKTPLSITMKVVRNAKNEGSEICVWYVNQYLAKGSPWDEGDFVRVKIDSTGKAIELQETSPEQRGMGVSLSKVPGLFEYGKAFDLEFQITDSMATLLVNGKVISQVKHHLPSTKGYVHVHDWNSLEGDVDSISDFRVSVLK